MNRAWQYTMAFAMVIGPGAAAVMGQPAIPWSTIDGGGGASSGGGFELSGTVGQPDASAASALTGGGYELTGGYWGVILPACTVFAAPDFDQDCSVDNQDLAIF
jgi:energy-converting hydrogenase Eha subunit B